MMSDQLRAMGLHAEAAQAERLEEFVGDIADRLEGCYRSRDNGAGCQATQGCTGICGCSAGCGCHPLEDDRADFLVLVKREVGVGRQCPGARHPQK